MISLTIRNLTTGETIDLVLDVSHTHPDWVHDQCDTSSEGDLQAMLDQISYRDYVTSGRDAIDECGIAADIPPDAVAWKYADPSEGDRWLTADEAKEAEKDDPSLVVYVGA